MKTRMIQMAQQQQPQQLPTVLTLYQNLKNVGASVTETVWVGGDSSGVVSFIRENELTESELSRMLPGYGVSVCSEFGPPDIAEDICEWLKESARTGFFVAIESVKSAKSPRVVNFFYGDRLEAALQHGLHWAQTVYKDDPSSSGSNRYPAANEVPLSQDEEE
jgi:hypothetical protein